MGHFTWCVVNYYCVSLNSLADGNAVLPEVPVDIKCYTFYKVLLAILGGGQGYMVEEVERTVLSMLEQHRAPQALFVRL